MRHGSVDYQQRSTQDGVLVRVLREHLDSVVDQVRCQSGRSLPAFVINQLRAMMTCGDFLEGFVRFECSSCRAPLVVPFSCKSRVCPSCSGRRMSEQAAHLVDRVLPSDVPYRQWVLTFPWDLARRLAFDAELSSAVVRLVMRVLFAWLRERSPAPPSQSHPGAVVFVQRFSDGAGLFLHLHILALDGVFVGGSESTELGFHPVAPPEQEDIAELVAQLHRRIVGLLARRGLLQGDDRDNEDPLSAGDTQLLLACANAQPTRGSGARSRRRPARSARRQRGAGLKATAGGFDLHADVVVDPFDRPALERLCRYLARPPVPTDRVRLNEDGKVVFRLKRPSRSGAMELVFEPLAFLARLAALRAPDPSSCEEGLRTPHRDSTSPDSSAASPPAPPTARLSCRPPHKQSRTADPSPPNVPHRWAGPT